MGGSGPKTVGGSSWMNSELDEYGLRRVKLYVQCGGIMWKVISSRLEL
jgi:hypothetical protein